MALETYTYTKTPVALDSLTLEIQESNITIALDHITNTGAETDNLQIVFKDLLSAGEITLLNTVVTNHTGVSLPDNEAKLVTLSNIPPKSADGDWHVVHENFAHVTGNAGINWTLDKFIESGESYSEKLFIPNGRSVTLDQLHGGSPDGPTTITLDWYEYCTHADTYIRKNPWIRSEEIRNLQVIESYTTGATAISVSSYSSALDDLITGWYCFFDYENNNHFIKRVYSIDSENGLINVSGGSNADGIPSGISSNTFVTLIERHIGVISSQIGSQFLHWDSPPNGFNGDGLSYFMLTLKNEHDTDGCFISAALNGWHTDTITGD